MADHEHAPAGAGPGGRQIHYNHITVQPITPPEPVVVCTPGFVTQLAAVEWEIAHLEIKDDASMQEAARIQTRITSAGKLLEETRKKVKAPFLAKAAEIDAAARAPATRIEQAKQDMSAKLVAYQLKVRDAAERAETARQAELERLEKIRQQEVAAENKRIADLAAEVDRKRKEQAAADEAARVAGLPPVMEVDFGDDDAPAAPPPPAVPDKTETERRIEAVRYAPAAVAPAKAAGLRYVVKVIHSVTDVSALPEAFVTRMPKDAAIRATFCAGWKEGEPLPVCPGVNFKIQRDAVSSGKVEF